MASKKLTPVGVYSRGGVQNRFIPRKELRQEGRYSYGLNDKLPQEIIEMVAGNPTAVRCVMKIAEYITAKGFADEKLNDFMVTKDKTARKLLSETAIQYAMFECVCWHVARKANNTIGTVDMHPFEMTRRTPSGSLQYNPTIMMSGMEKQTWTPYPLFRKEGTVTKDYKGEILYEWNRTPIAFNHPIPSWFAGEYTIKTGIELSLMDLETVENGFMPSAILTYIGQLDDVNKDENGYTQKQRFAQLLEKWTSKSKDPVTGKSLRHSIMVMTAESKEMVPDLQSFDIDKIITGSIEKKEAIDKDTCRVFNVNPVLLNWESSSFFNSGDAIKNMKAEMANSVLVAQNLIKECFEKVWPEHKWDITTLNPYTQVVEKTEDQKILDTLNSLSPLIAAEVVRNMPKNILLRIIGIDTTNLPPEPPAP